MTVSTKIKPKLIISNEEAIKVLFSQISVFTAFDVPEEMEQWSNIEESDKFSIMQAQLLNQRLKILAFAVNQALNLSKDLDWLDSACDDVFRTHAILKGHTENGFTLQDLIDRTSTLEGVLIQLIDKIT